MMENAIASGMRARATTVPAITSRRGFENHSWKYLFCCIVGLKNKTADATYVGGVRMEQDKAGATNQVEVLILCGQVEFGRCLKPGLCKRLQNSITAYCIIRVKKMTL
jgi:hypothetical protein